MNWLLGAGLVIIGVVAGALGCALWFAHQLTRNW